MRRSAALFLVFALTACREEPDPLRLSALHRLKDARPAARIVAIKTLSEGATRTELAAIARAATGSNAEVKLAAIEAFELSPRPEVVDFLGSLALEPGVRTQGLNRALQSSERDDEVRAKAVAALAKRNDAKSKAYLARAWEGGGPQVRAAVSRAGVLAEALAAETAYRLEKAEKNHASASIQLRAEGIREMGLHGSAEAKALVARVLAEGGALEAAAAARVLAEVGDRSQLEGLIAQLERPLVGAAVAETLVELSLVEKAQPALAAALRGVSKTDAPSLFTALESAPVSEEVRVVACEAAGRLDEASLAARAAALAGPGCLLALPTKADPPELLAARLTALAVQGQRQAKLLPFARELLGHEKVSVALAAATWLAVAGEASDGPRLLETATNERYQILGGRLAQSELRRMKKEVIQNLDEEERRRLMELAPTTNPGTGGMPQRLATLIQTRQATSELALYEPRVGSHAFVAACSLGAAKLGADVSLHAHTLLDDEDERLRLLAVELADMLEGEQGEKLRARVRQSEDPEVRRQMALRDLAARREGALERVLEFVKTSEQPKHRMDLASALAPHASAALAELTGLSRGGDLAVPMATQALTGVKEEQATLVFFERLKDVRSLGALDAVEALASREGEAVVAALADAAFHPAPEVQVSALRGLSERKACAERTRIEPLEKAFDVRVREAVAAYRRACTGG